MAVRLQPGIEDGLDQDGRGQPSYLPVQVPGRNVGGVWAVILEIVVGGLLHARNSSTKKGAPDSR
jgi:hypothetical protein